MDHEDVRSWVGGYERAWRTPGTTDLPGLFTQDASYSVSPWAAVVEGIDAIAELWDGARVGPDEPFTMSSDVVAVDGRTAVVRVHVDYQAGGHHHWRDLWVLRFATDGRCSAFEEWPFAPDQADGR